MPSIYDIQQGSANFDLAITAATISILIGGLLFGVGLGFSIRRLKLLGAEEIGQGIISAAMLGGIVAFTAFLQTTFSTIPLPNPPLCPQIQNPTASPHAYYACNLAALEGSLRNLSSLLFRASDIAGFVSSIQLSLGVVSAQPFFALRSISEQLSGASYLAQLASAIAFVEFEVLDFVSKSSLSIFLPAGLLLRTFFATRRLGAAAMAIAVSAFAVYPLLFTYTFSVSGSMAEISKATQELSEFNSQFASIPLTELDETSAVRSKIKELSEGDFGAKVQPLLPLSNRAVLLSLIDLLLFPLLSLAVSAVAAYEFYRLFSAPVFSIDISLI